MCTSEEKVQLTVESELSEKSNNENIETQKTESSEPNEETENNIDSLTNTRLNSTKNDVPQQGNCEERRFNGVEISKLTKRQLKKYKKCLKWEEVKKEKRAKQRVKNKERKHHARLNNISLGPSRKELKMHKMANSPCKIRVCIDLSFDHLMIDKDMAKTIKQILRIYTENRRAKAPMQLYLCDFNGRSGQEMKRHHGFEHWDIHFETKGYIDVFSKDELIYLTSESDNVITELEFDKVYIIGGLVDHNAHKGICYEKALAQGIKHGQLPIGKYFQMQHRKVLTINQVFEILLRVSEGKSFKDALEMVIPKRAHMKSNENDENETRKESLESEEMTC